MSTNKQSSEHSATPEEVWPRKLNKLLIGIGVLAFGFIIADRLVNMFEADDLPTVVDAEPSGSTSHVALTQTGESAVLAPNGDQLQELSSTEKEIATDTLSIDDVFGGPLVFVSASEPAYVITENDVRIDVGAQLGGDIRLAGVTGDRVILDKAGDLLSISLPDPNM